VLINCYFDIIKPKMIMVLKRQTKIIIKLLLSLKTKTVKVPGIFLVKICYIHILNTFPTSCIIFFVLRGIFWYIPLDHL